MRRPTDIREWCAACMLSTRLLVCRVRAALCQQRFVCEQATMSGSAGVRKRENTVNFAPGPAAIPDEVCTCSSS